MAPRDGCLHHPAATAGVCECAYTHGRRHRRASPYTRILRYSGGGRRLSAVDDGGDDLASVLSERVRFARVLKCSSVWAATQSTVYRRAVLLPRVFIIVFFF